MDESHEAVSARKLTQAFGWDSGQLDVAQDLRPLLSDWLKRLPSGEMIRSVCQGMIKLHYGSTVREQIFEGPSARASI